MSEFHEFDEPELFTCGTVGPPGQRVFLLQAVQGPDTVTVKVEKQHVQRLAGTLAQILESEPITDGPPVSVTSMVQPIEPQWIAGSLLVALDRDSGRLQLVIEEFEFLDEDDELTVENVFDDDDGPNELHVSLTANQIRAFISTAEVLMSASRPACRLCGGPMEPTGHDCPRWN